MKKRKTMAGADIEKKIIKEIVNEMASTIFKALSLTMESIGMTKRERKIFIYKFQENLMAIAKKNLETIGKE
jgi:hypothetical protein